MRHQPLDKSLKTSTGSIWAARLFSNIASPPALFSGFAFLMAWTDRRTLAGLLWAALYGFLASLLPVLYLVYLYKMGRVRDIHVSSIEERQIPYLVGLAGAVIAFFMVRAWGHSPLLTNLILSHLALMVVLTAANAVWLISAHVAAVTTLTLLSGMVYGFVFSLLLLPLIPLTFYIRRYLKRHTSAELYSGLFVGAGIVILLAATGAYT
jgi:hypothetical protein